MFLNLPRHSININTVTFIYWERQGAYVEVHFIGGNKLSLFNEDYEAFCRLYDEYVDDIEKVY